jgi:predicted ArsR family transcriptional regulator
MAVRVNDDKAQRFRHSALADLSRRELLRLLQGVENGLDTAEIATKLGLHVNTVRWHLRVLTDAGLVTREPRGGTRGRPAHAYRLAERAEEPNEQRLLTEILLAALHDTSPRPEKQAEKAGRARGRALVFATPEGNQRKSDKAVGQVVHLLELLGFEPRRERTRSGPRIAMRPCPFGETLADHSAIVCSAHLGFVRGALENLKAPLDTAGIEPFAKPDICFIHLRSKAR